MYDGSGQLAAEYSNQINNNPQVSYLTADHLGSPRIVTDAAGSVISRHDYMAFGDEVSSAMANRSTTTTGYNMADNIRQQYTGYQKDEESGLDYAQARFYNPAHGRFTSVDPLTASATIRNPQTFNRYSYVLNSPYKFTDPLGLFPGCRCIHIPSTGWWQENGIGAPPEHAKDTTASNEQPQQAQQGQQAESPATAPEPPPPPAGPRPEPESKDSALAQQDKDLAKILTNGNGIVRGSEDRGKNKDGLGHFQTVDGSVYTVHVYGNQEGNSLANLYVPSGFTATYQGGANNQVVATNKDTKEVIVFVHVQGVNSQKELDKNMKSKSNSAGSKYIGQIGGAKSNASPNYIHAHITIYKNAAARKDIINQTIAGQINNSSGYGDFRKLLNRSYFKIRLTHNIMHASTQNAL